MTPDAESVEQATQRGEGLRAEIMSLLADNQRTAAALERELKETPGVTLSEVIFQLKRLAEEGTVVGDEGGRFHLSDKHAAS